MAAVRKVAEFLLQIVLELRKIMACEYVHGRGFIFLFYFFWLWVWVLFFYLILYKEKSSI